MALLDLIELSETNSYFAQKQLPVSTHSHFWQYGYMRACGQRILLTEPQCKKIGHFNQKAFYCWLFLLFLCLIQIRILEFIKANCTVFYTGSCFCAEQSHIFSVRRRLPSQLIEAWVAGKARGTAVCDSHCKKNAPEDSPPWRQTLQINFAA